MFRFRLSKFVSLTRTEMRTKEIYEAIVRLDNDALHKALKQNGGCDQEMLNNYPNSEIDHLFNPHAVGMEKCK